MRALHAESKNFFEYVKRNRWQILIFNALLLLVWLPWLFDTTPKVDTEELINVPYSTLNWLMIGRQGGILTEYVFGLRWFNPYFSTLFGYLLICVAGTLFGYLLYRAGLKSRLFSTGFGLLCFSAPMMTEQFYFQMQIFKVAWAYILCITAAGLSLKAVLSRSFIAQIIAFLCMLWCFSTYQAFVILYITIIVACFILLYQKWTLCGERPNRKYGRFVVELILGFLAAFLVNTLITKLFFSAGGYLQGQVVWNTQPIMQCVRNIREHLRKGFMGDGVFYTAFYGMLALLVLAAAIVRVCRAKNRQGAFLYFAAVVGLQFMPFLLTVALGGEPVPRAQIIYPVAVSCNLIIIAAQFRDNIYLRAVSLLLAVLVCRTQIYTTERLLYSDVIRAQEDARLAAELECCINEVTDSNKKPIAFIGVYNNHLNNSSIHGDVVGTSLFNFNSNIEPHYVISGQRDARLLKTQGFAWKEASEEQVLEARKKAFSMPCWPAKESVADAGDYIIVKLSEDAWPEEITEGEISEISFDKPIRSADRNTLQFCIDSVEVSGSDLSALGWAFLNGVDSTSVTTSLYLYDKEKEVYLAITTFQKQRPDLVSAFDNGVLYEYGGYSAKADISGLEKPLDAYKLYVGIETKDEVIMADTNYPLS